MPGTIIILQPLERHFMIIGFPFSAFENRPSPFISRESHQLFGQGWGKNSGAAHLSFRPDPSQRQTAFFKSFCELSSTRTGKVGLIADKEAKGFLHLQAEAVPGGPKAPVPSLREPAHRKNPTLLLADPIVPAGSPPLQDIRSPPLPEKPRCKGVFPENWPTVSGCRTGGKPLPPAE